MMGQATLSNSFYSAGTQQGGVRQIRQHSVCPCCGTLAVIGVKWASQHTGCLWCSTVAAIGVDGMSPHTVSLWCGTVAV